MFDIDIVKGSAQEYHPEAPVLTPEIQEEMLIDPHATWSS